jgi:3-phosphoshikimate 1-carboxyvinyltransferase
MAPLHDALVALGADVTWGEDQGHLPVTIGRGASDQGRDGVVVSMPGDVSSQYVTALMLIAPLLPGGLSIELTSDLVSRPYVEITAAVMASGGSAGFNRSSASRKRDTNITSPFVSRSNVPAAPKVSSKADTVCQPSSANNPIAGCSTSWSSV